MDDIKADSRIKSQDEMDRRPNQEVIFESAISESKVFSPIRLGDLELPNRVLRTAAFEGMCPDGIPSDELIEHHRKMAAGGVGMTTVAYCSVSPLGLTFKDQMWMRPEVVAGLKNLTRAVHAEGGAACLQLGHAGYFADKQTIGRSPMGASKVFNLYGLAMAKEMNESEIQGVVEDFVRSVRMARDAGFDSVELHMGHGYLLSQFLSPFTNRRKDSWGGSLENRMKLPLEVARKVRDAVGPGFPLLAKINLSDGFKKGLPMDEAVEFARALDSDGSITALVLSGGFVSRTPWYMIRGRVPIKEMAAVQKKWIRRMGLTFFGRVFVGFYPYEDLFFLKDASKVRKAVEMPLVLVGGVRSREGMKKAMDEGFDMVAIGRALIMDPDFVKKIRAGELDVSECDQCNRCISEMEKNGIRCVTLEDGPLPSHEV